MVTITLPVQVESSGGRNLSAEPSAEIFPADRYPGGLALEWRQPFDHHRGGPWEGGGLKRLISGRSSTVHRGNGGLMITARGPVAVPIVLLCALLGDARAQPKPENAIRLTPRPS